MVINKIVISNYEKLQQIKDIIEKDRINVFSWNISWGAMTNNSKDFSTTFLASNCINDICLKNVGNYIKQLLTTSQYDFLSFQEASRISNIFDIINMKEKYKLISHEIGQFKITIATMYNMNKYILLQNKIIETINFDNKQDIRPMQLLLVQSKLNNKYIFFINLHAHYENIITDQFINHIKDFITQNEHIHNGTYNIIIAGDWNDSAKTFYLDSDIISGEKAQDYWKKGIKINELLISTNNVKPPPTCCSGKNEYRGSKYNTVTTIDGKKVYNDVLLYSSYFNLSYEEALKKHPTYTDPDAVKKDNRYGDYIMADNFLNFVKNNYIPVVEGIDLYKAESFPTSDHLPVAVQLEHIQRD
jgi:hypothetical protein